VRYFLFSNTDMSEHKLRLTDLSLRFIILFMKLFAICFAVMLLTFTACPSSKTGSPTTTGLFVEIVSVAQSPDRSDDAIISVKTSPGAECTIVIKSPSGAISDPRLTTKKADKKGNVSWTMRLSISNPSGAYVFTVTAVLNGVTQTGVNSFRLN
jgi:hypothetical protein